MRFSIYCDLKEFTLSMRLSISWSLKTGAPKTCQSLCWTLKGDDMWAESDTIRICKYIYLTLCYYVLYFHISLYCIVLLTTCSFHSNISQVNTYIFVFSGNGAVQSCTLVDAVAGFTLHAIGVAPHDAIRKNISAHAYIKLIDSWRHKTKHVCTCLYQMKKIGLSVHVYIKRKNRHVCTCWKK